jgi:hypothetical protein
MHVHIASFFKLHNEPMIIKHHRQDASVKKKDKHKLAKKKSSSEEVTHAEKHFKNSTITHLNIKCKTT